MLRTEEVKLIIIAYLKYHSYSQRTIDHHALVLTLFHRYLLSEKKSNDYREVRQTDLYSFIEYCKMTSKKGLGAICQNSYIGSMKTIFRILAEEDKILFNPFGEVGYIKTVSIIRDKILSIDEVEQLFNGADTTLIGVRDRTVLAVLYGAGLRSGELFNLELQDFVNDEKLLFVRHGKGKKDRVVPLGESTFTALHYFIRKVRPKLVRKKAVKNIFTKKNIKKLDPDALGVILRHAVKNAGLERKVTPHMFRHTFSTHLLNNGADIREVQLLLGHSHIKSTAIYLNLTTAHLKDVYEKYHPLENELYFDVYGREQHIFSDEISAGTRLCSKKNLTAG